MSDSLIFGGEVFFKIFFIGIFLYFCGITDVLRCMKLKVFMMLLAWALLSGLRRIR